MRALHPRRVAAAGVLLAGGTAVGLWYRRKTTPFPYAHRWMLDKELPYLTVARLCDVLAPGPGERMLEIGPGTGLFSLPVARALLPGGRLDVIDIQQPMVDHTLHQARQEGVENIDGHCADALRLPFEERSFDGAFMMTVLGELRDTDGALRELARVLKPGGRLVVGEFLIDWHAVPARSLRRRAERQGFVFEHRAGPSLSYLTRLRASGPD